jgi:hypothetical protein
MEHLLENKGSIGVPRKRKKPPGDVFLWLRYFPAVFAFSGFIEELV